MKAFWRDVIGNVNRFCDDGHGSGGRNMSLWLISERDEHNGTHQRPTTRRRPADWLNNWVNGTRGRGLTTRWSTGLPVLWGSVNYGYYARTPETDPRFNLMSQQSRVQRRNGVHLIRFNSNTFTSQHNKYNNFLLLITISLQAPADRHPSVGVGGPILSPL